MGALLSLYDDLQKVELGSKSHTTHFETWPSTIITLLMMSGTFACLATIPATMNVEWNLINSVSYAWAWSIWLVLSGVMTRLDWTIIGTLFEIAHPMIECLLTFTCFKQFFAGVIICSIVFSGEIICALRISPVRQYAVAVLMGSLSHYANLIALILFVVQQQQHQQARRGSILWLLPSAMMMHFTYDLFYLILSNTTNRCMNIEWKLQVWLPFCNCMSIFIICLFICNYKEQKSEIAELLWSFF